MNITSSIILMTLYSTIENENSFHGLLNELSNLEKITKLGFNTLLNPAKLKENEENPKFDSSQCQTTFKISRKNHKVDKTPPNSSNSTEFDKKDKPDNEQKEAPETKPHKQEIKEGEAAEKTEEAQTNQMTERQTNPYGDEIEDRNEWSSDKEVKHKHEIATASSYPFMVKILLKKQFLCEGVIIAKKWILTAAHCFKKLACSYHEEVKIAADKITVPVESVIKHPSYEKDSLMFDLALVKLCHPLEEMQPIKLSNQIIAGEVEAIGWSHHTLDQSEISQNLLHTKSEIVNEAACGNFFPDFNPEEKKYVLNRIICVDNRIGNDGCFGGAGSPLVDGTGLIGISTLMTGCFQTEPAYFTRLEKYRNWINAITGIEEQ